MVDSGRWRAGTVDRRVSQRSFLPWTGTYKQRKMGRRRRVEGRRVEGLYTTRRESEKFMLCSLHLSCLSYLAYLAYLGL